MPAFRPRGICNASLETECRLVLPTVANIVFPLFMGTWPGDSLNPFRNLRKINHLSPSWKSFPNYTHIYIYIYISGGKSTPYFELIPIGPRIFKLWVIKMFINRKDVRLPIQLQRAMAAEAEAAREARAKVRRCKTFHPHHPTGHPTPIHQPTPSLTTPSQKIRCPTTNKSKLTFKDSTFPA